MRPLPATPKFVAISLAALAFYAFCNFSTARAQCQNDQSFDFVVAHDTTLADTVARTLLSAVIRLDLDSDSCVSVYQAGEFKLNGSRIHLPNWCRDSVRVSWDIPTLNANNYTQSFILNTGDNIHFLREFGWYDPDADPDSAEQTYSNFHSLDTIDYTVELVRPNGTRLALLDSIGVLSRSTRGAPTYYGTGSIIRSVNYAVLPTMNGDTALIRVRASARGDGEYNFRRVDRVGINLEGKISDAAYAHYITTFGGTIAGKPISWSEISGKQYSENLKVDVARSGVTMRFYTPSDVRSVVVAVYKTNGEFVVMPAATEAQPPSWSQVHFQAESAGHYMIALFYDGVPVVSKKVIILE